MRKPRLLEVAIFSLVPLGAYAGKFQLGRIASADDIRALDISVAPDGAGLPEGGGTARQGSAVYALRCAVCHGLTGEGVAPYPSLAGGQGTLKSDKPVLTVGSYWPYATTVWDYIRRSMPPQDPGSLGADEIYSTTAFILYLNGIVAEDDVMNARTLPKVRMPNCNGFIADPRPDTGTLKRRDAARSSKAGSVPLNCND